MLPKLIQSLEVNARQVDRTFAQAGAELGQGLSLFEALKERLSALSGELTGPEISQAGIILAGLSGELRAIGDGLRGETNALQVLARHSHEASQALERLLDHMRLITILARSARIEAVSVHATSRDFGDFTSEIVSLTTQAQHTIQNCARQHGHLSGLLGAALAAQCDFEQRYGAALLALADNLGRTIAEVAARQQRSIALTSEAAVHSGKIAAASGGAIIALQSGDSIRQRLEHAIAALRLLASVEAGTGEAAELNRHERDAAAQILRRLEAAQLDASSAVLGEDAEAIESALALLAGDTAGLLDLVRSLYSGGGRESFLAALETDLAQASDLLGKCDKARMGVDAVTQTLTGVLETCQQTVAALADTVSSIVLIGMNAGLRAARVGTGGRSLVVIAQELKIAADQVATDAARLTPTFAEMRQAASGLTRDGRLDAAYFTALDRSMQDALSAMRQTGERLRNTLDQLAREGGGFHEVLARARLSFSNAGAICDVIAGAAAELARPVDAATIEQSHEAERAAAFLGQHVRPHYTMVAERDIYRDILAEHGILEHGVATGIVTSRGARDDEAIDEFMF